MLQWEDVECMKKELVLMKLRKYILCIAIGALVATAFTGCKKADDTNKEKKDSADYELSEEGEIGLFREKFIKEN